MKQKNMILVAVAVGCGLVAAFLTSQMNANTAVDQVDVPVAAKDLPVGTRLTKDEMKTFIVYKKVSKDSLPAAYTATEAELLDKRLVRTIRQGESFNPADLTTAAVISAPAGYDMITIQANVVQGVGGFVTPGAKVDILASVKQTGKKNSSVVFPLLTDMLVLAINTETQINKDKAAFANMSNVSLAVTTEQAMLLHAAEGRNASLKLLLQHPDEDKKAKWTNVPTPEQIWAILADEPVDLNRGGGESGELPEPAPAEAAADTIKLPVPKEDLPAGTQLTADLIEKKFMLLEVKPPAPTNFVQNLKEHSGRFLTEKLTANSFVPLAYLGDKPADAAPQVAEAPKETKPPVKAAPPVYFESTFQTTSGYKRYRWQVLKDGGHKFLGEVLENGELRQAGRKTLGEDEDEAPAPEAKPDEKKKPEAGERVI